MTIVPDRDHTLTTDQPGGLPSRRGWLLPALMIALVTFSGLSVSLSWDGENSWRFTLIALIAGVVSASLARTRIFDGTAIVLSMVFGVATIWSTTALFGGHLEGGAVSRLSDFPTPMIDALIHNQISDANRDLTAETLLSLTIWMSSWIAVWMLLRLGYVVLALVPPCVLILANAHFADGDSTWIPVVMIALSLLIVVLQRIRDHSARWRARRIDVADSVFGRAAIIGVALALVISSTILVAPSAWSESTLQPLIERAVERFDSLRIEAQYWFDDVFGTDSAPPRAGNYTDFSDGFAIGGPLSLTDQPEVLVQIETLNAPYLKARTYDHYTGRGWTSSAAGVFADEDESERVSPELLYNPGWDVALSEEARNHRERNTAMVTPLTPGSDVVLTVDSFVSADIQTVVRMSWTHVVDLPLPITIGELTQLPPDVQKLGSLLLQSELGGDITAWGPGATSPTMQEAIDAEVDDLARRGIEVRWTATSDGIVDTLFITGRLPVFDDVEAVFRPNSSATASPTYRVDGLSSVATSDQLIAAGTDYPTWIVDRYLQTGDSMTDRTLQLTHEIVGDETNPYSQATLIEEWLRTNITYDDTVDAPPGDQDLVDYVLFDHRYGYCEHYAAAMTVMMRSLGVPARVAVGYSPGEWDPAQGGFIYRQNNAHAWVEVYFPGYGWIPFEPTANRPLGEFDIEPAERTGENLNQVPTETVPTPPMVPTSEISTPDVQQDNSQATPQPTSEDAINQPPVVLESDSSGGPPSWLKMTAGAVLVAAVIGAGAWLMWSWSLRGLAPAEGLMTRMRRVGGWIGVRSNDTTTSREFARRFESRAGGLTTPVRRITRAYEIETYGPPAMRDSILADARAAWGDIRRNMIRLLRQRRK